MKNKMKKGSSMITLIVVIVLVVALCVGAYFLVSSLYEKKLNQKIWGEKIEWFFSNCIFIFCGKYCGMVNRNSF